MAKTGMDFLMRDRLPVILRPFPLHLQLPPNPPCLIARVFRNYGHLSEEFLDRSPCRAFCSDRIAMVEA